jgi:peptide/nickel transport system substrate-binding protein
MSTLFAEENIPDLNFMGYINEDLEEIFRQGGATYDTEVRKEKYQEAQQILAEDAPYMFLFYSKSRSGQNERIQGIDPKPVGIGWNQEDWFIEESPE